MRICLSFSAFFTTGTEKNIPHFFYESATLPFVVEHRCNLANRFIVKRTNSCLHTYVSRPVASFGRERSTSFHCRPQRQFRAFRDCLQFVCLAYSDSVYSLEEKVVG